MKKFLIVFLLAIAFGICGVFSISLIRSSEARNETLVVYYFHGTMRCPTCYKLEKYSKEAIEANFKEELASGKLEFKVVNVEDKGNEHYAKDYQLYTKTLILSLTKDGKQIKWVNLDKIWEYVGNKQRFIDYVKSGVADLLKEVQ